MEKLFWFILLLCVIYGSKEEKEVQTNVYNSLTDLSEDFAQMLKSPMSPPPQFIHIELDKEMDYLWRASGVYKLIPYYQRISPADERSSRFVIERHPFNHEWQLTEIYDYIKRAPVYTEEMYRRTIFHLAYANENPIRDLFIAKSFEMGRNEALQMKDENAILHQKVKDLTDENVFLREQNSSLNETYNETKQENEILIKTGKTNSLEKEKFHQNEIKMLNEKLVKKENEIQKLKEKFKALEDENNYLQHKEGLLENKIEELERVNKNLQYKEDLLEEENTNLYQIQKNMKITLKKNKSELQKQTKNANDHKNTKQDIAKMVFGLVQTNMEKMKSAPQNEISSIDSTFDQTKSQWEMKFNKMIELMQEKEYDLKLQTVWTKMMLDKKMPDKSKQKIIDILQDTKRFLEKKENCFHELKVIQGAIPFTRNQEENIDENFKFLDTLDGDSKPDEVKLRTWWQETGKVLYLGILKSLQEEQKQLLGEKLTSMKGMPKNINDPKFENYLIEVGAIYGARQVIDALKKIENSGTTSYFNRRRRKQR